MGRTPLSALMLMAAALGVTLPVPLARAARDGAERTDADRAALRTAEEKRARKAAKRVAQSR